MKVFMKYMLLLFALSASILQTAQADPPSVHGMLILGENKIYLSHLPMFHPPHDYQAIFEAAFTSAALATYLKAKHAAPKDTIFTLVPEPFRLDQMIQNPKPFRAVIYRGHFERGGVPITEAVQVDITKVVFSKHLDPDEPRPKSIEYLLFGSPGEYFLAHLITGKPNFDQILVTNSLSPIQDDSVFLESFSGISDLSPPAVSQLEEKLSGLTQIYLETDDLSM
jgi:hypothetical protein